MRYGSFKAALLLGMAGLVVGCSESSTGPEGELIVSFVADAAEDTAYVALGESASARTIGDHKTSTEWDIAFFATTVLVNGGLGGPGGVATYCVCQNSAATNAEVMAMTAASELADFETVTAASIPVSPTAWNTGGESASGAFDANRWYRYNLNNDHQVWPTYEVYLLKRGTSVYKVQITSYYGPGGEARQIGFRFAKIAG